MPPVDPLLSDERIDPGPSGEDPTWATSRCRIAVLCAERRPADDGGPISSYVSRPTRSALCDERRAVHNRSTNTLSRLPPPADDILERLLARVPSRAFRGAIRWLRRPSSRWARIPAGVLLIVGGGLSILPLLGIWMLPLGLFLLADDVPLLQRGRGRILDWIVRRRPHWLAP